MHRDCTAAPALDHTQPAPCRLNRCTSSPPHHLRTHTAAAAAAAPAGHKRAPAAAVPGGPAGAEAIHLTTGRPGEDIRIATAPGEYAVDRAYHPDPSLAEEAHAAGRREGGELPGGSVYTGGAGCGAQGPEGGWPGWARAAVQLHSCVGRKIKGQNGCP